MIIKKYLSNVIEIKNFFKGDDLEKIHGRFKKNKSWKKIFQKRESHYSHVFKSNSLFLPSKEEEYLSSFYRNEKLSKDKFILNTVEEAVNKFFKKYYNKNILNLDIRCHKFKKGDYFRIHMDGYAGGHALTISLNKEWKWDWGGVLNILHGKNYSETLGLIPKWNVANILNNNINPSPHFVTPIQKFAKEDRYTITCFIKV